jgi:hypothetical protein
MSELTDEQKAEMYKKADKANFTTEIQIRNVGDSDDIYYFNKAKKHVGSGFIPKEGERKGHICVTRCPGCERENYAMNVLSGYCTWCPFNANGESN